MLRSRSRKNENWSIEHSWAWFGAAPGSQHELVQEIGDALPWVRCRQREGDQNAWGLVSWGGPISDDRGVEIHPRNGITGGPLRVVPQGVSRIAQTGASPPTTFLPLPIYFPCGRCLSYHEGQSGKTTSRIRCRQGLKQAHGKRPTVLRSFEHSGRAVGCHDSPPAPPPPCTAAMALGSTSRLLPFPRPSALVTQYLRPFISRRSSR